MKPAYKHLDTQLIHAGERESRVEGALVLPVFQSSTYEYAGESGYEEIRYIRLNNTPNHQVLHRKLATLERGEEALVTSSGMAAITATLLSILKAGDHLLVQDTLYGGTFTFLTQDLPAFGISFDFIDGSNPASWEEKVKPATRAIYVESLTNPLLQVADLPRVVELARRHDLVSLVDNTFPSPVNFRPLELGFDLSLHSCTKYLNGHSDLVAGAVIGRAHWISRIRHRLAHLGGTLDPHACFLLHRGLKTLALRVRQQNSNAQQLAAFLASHPRVRTLHYPGLSSHPQHELARKLFSGFGGMLSFELQGGLEETERFMSRLQIPVEAPSLGGVETLITRPVLTSHSGMDPEERRSRGISETLIRVSVGIEAAADLIDDFRQALDD